MEKYDVTLFFEASEDMISIVDAEGYFKRVNPSFTKVLGYEKDELENKKFIEFVHPNDRERTLELFADMVGKNQPINYFENRYKAKNGDYKWLLWSGTAPNEKGIIYAVAKDITEQKESSLQIEEYSKTLEDTLKRLM